MNLVNNNEEVEAAAAASTTAPNARLYERRADRRSTQLQLINLSNLPKELRLSQRKSKSISFSGISYAIDRLLSMKHSMSSSQLEAEEALQSGDTERILAIQSSRDGKKLSGLAKAAMRAGNEELIEATLASIDDLSTTNHYGLLHVAAEHGLENVCTLLVDKYGLSPMMAFDSEGYTPIHYAAREGHLGTLILMHTQFRGDLNASQPNRENGPWTPLHAAVLGNQVATVKYLLANKANTAPVSFSSTPLHLAAENNSVECIDALLAHSALVDPLRGQRERVTPLHIACSNGYLEAAQTLLQHGADPNSRNGRGETPLHLACRVLAAPLIVALIEKGAMVEAVDPEGRPPLHYVINSKQRGGGRECMKILLERGANINQVDNIGMTPVHIAAVNANSSKLEYLIEQGADLCMRNNAGKSGLQFALKHLPSTTMAAIRSRMDASMVMTSGAESEMDSEVKLDFGMFLPPAQVNPKNARSDVEMFNEMLRFSVHIDKLLLHPLSQCYLHLKWAQIQNFYYFLIVLAHLIYSVIYTAYSAAVFRFLCSPVGQNADVIVCNFTKEVPRDTALTCWIFLNIFTIIYVIYEGTKAMHLKWQYLKEYESWLNICTNLSFILISFHNNPFAWKEADVVMGRWQYHVNGIGVFATWLLQMFLIGRVPRFGLYVEIFKKVSKTFINFFLAFIFLFVAFAASFLALFPEHRAFSSYSPAVMIKVMVMMLGELEYDDLLHPTNLEVKTNGSQMTIDEVAQSQNFPFASQVMVAIFILLVSFIIMNLLFGLAVADIQELYKVARVHQLIQQVQLISYMERVLLSPASNYLPQRLNAYIRHKFKGLRTNGRYFHIRNSDKTQINHRGLPADLVYLTYSKASELSRQEKKEASLSIEKRLSELTEKMDLLQKLLMNNYRDQSHKAISSISESTVSVRSSNNPLDDNRTLTL